MAYNLAYMNYVVDLDELVVGWLLAAVAAAD